MDKFTEIKYEIKKIDECISYLEKAYKCLTDVDDTDEAYEEIYNVSEKINDIRLNKEIILESLEW